ncbi:hypothetical protein HQ571_03990 [Candidatus Kuenenbacteria bacterium]|nr:hypothetical protein [Candidatus Kuenenbacteria bacterium]
MSERKQQTPERIAQLAEQFPALKWILPCYQVEETKRDKQILHIGVQRVDENFLFAHAEHIGDETRFSVFQKGESSYNGKHWVHFYVIEQGHELEESSGLQQERQGSVKSFLSGYYENLSQVNHIIKVDARYYYEAQDDMRNPFGDFAGAEIEVTIVHPPKGKDGLKDLIEKAKLTSGEVRITTQDQLTGMLNKDSEWEELSDQLGLLTDRFTARVLVYGLKKAVEKSPSGKLSAEFDGVNLMTFYSAGRMLFTLEDENHMITFIADGTSEWHRTGIQGVAATYEGAKSLVDRVVKGWQRHTMRKMLKPDEVGDIMKEDPAVSYCGL